MKKQNLPRIFVFLLLVFMNIGDIAPIHAKGYGDHPWSFGIFSGILMGVQNVNENVEPCEDNPFCFITAILDGLENLYGSIPVMGVVDYRFHPHWSVRGGLGIDIYSDGDVYYHGMPRVFPAGEALAVWHIREKRSLFHPYLAGELRFPIANLAIGLGNQFNITDRFTLFAESGLNSLPTLDTKVELRLGVLFHY